MYGVCVCVWYTHSRFGRRGVCVFPVRCNTCDIVCNYFRCKVVIHRNPTSTTETSISTHVPAWGTAIHLPDCSLLVPRVSTGTVCYTRMAVTFSFVQLDFFWERESCRIQCNSFLNVNIYISNATVGAQNILADSKDESELLNQTLEKDPRKPAHPWPRSLLEHGWAGQSIPAGYLSLASALATFTD